MATIETKRITELPVAASVSGSEAIPLVQAGVTYQTTLQTIADQMLAGPAGPTGPMGPAGPTGATGATGADGPDDAIGINYNNTASALTAVDVQAAIDELAIMLAEDVVLDVNGLTGNVTLNDGNVKSVITALTSGTTITVDCSLGRNFTITLGHNVGTLTLSNLAGAGYATEIEVEIKQNGTGGFTFALPASFKALGGSDTAIAAGANAVTVLSAKTFDNGTTWRYAMQESA